MNKYQWHVLIVLIDLTTNYLLTSVIVGIGGGSSYKTYFGGNLDFNKIKKLIKVWSDV